MTGTLYAVPPLTIARSLRGATAVTFMVGCTSERTVTVAVVGVVVLLQERSCLSLSGTVPKSPWHFGHITDAILAPLLKCI